MGFSSFRPVQFTCLSKTCKGCSVWNVLLSSYSGSSCCNSGDFSKISCRVGRPHDQQVSEVCTGLWQRPAFCIGRLKLPSLGKTGISGSRISFCVVTGSRWGAPAGRLASRGLCTCNQGSLELTAGTLLPLGHIRVLLQNALHVRTNTLIQINFSLILRMGSKCCCCLLRLLTS